MKNFEDFQNTYGLPENCEKPSEENINTYEKLLPSELLDYWREVGWCSYGKGLLWLVNPKQFEGIVEDWVDFESGTPIVFLRSSFAHVYLWHEGFVYSLDVQYGDLSQVTKNIQRIFTLLCDEEIQDKILRIELHEQAVSRLGPPARDECYAFEPTLVLGGPGTLDTVRRVKIREHLGLLAQMVLGK